METTYTIAIQLDIAEILSCLQHPETNGIQITPNFDPEDERLVLRIEPTETHLQYGEHEREAIWGAKELRGALATDGWNLIVAASRFDGPFQSPDLAAALDISEEAVAHRMRALGRTHAYKKLDATTNGDVPIRSRRERGVLTYWMAPWWQNAIQTITSEEKAR